MDRHPERWPDKLLGLIPLPYPLAAGLIGLVMFLVLVLAAYLAGDLGHFFQNGLIQSVYPVLFVVYSLIAYKRADRYVAGALADFRPVVEVNDAEYQALVVPNPGWRDVIPALAGVVLGLALSLMGGPRLGLYSRLSRVLIMAAFGAVIVWLVYWAVGIGFRIARLHRHSFKINIFDPLPLTPIARISLSLSLVFIGLVTISLLITMQRGFDLSHDIRRLILTLFLLGVAVAIFFLPIFQTHRKMAAAKEHELSRIRQALLETYGELHRRQERGEPSGMEELADTIAAFLSYEKRVQEATEWPYSSGLLQEFAISSLVPVGAWLLDVFSDPLFFG